MSSKPDHKQMSSQKTQSTICSPIESAHTARQPTRVRKSQTGAHSAASATTKRRPHQLTGGRTSVKKSTMIKHVKVDDAKAVQQFAKNVKALHLKRSALEIQKKDFDAKYVGVDSKGLAKSPYDDALQLVDMEIATLKSSARTMFGGRAITLRLSAIFAVTNTGASVNARVLTLDVFNTSEWASIAALFDEVKTTAVDVAYFPSSSVPITVINAAVLVYDPIDNIALTGVVAGLQFQDHHLYPLAQGNGVLEQSLNNVRHLHIKVPPGDLIDAPTTANTICVGQSWVPTLTVTAGIIDPVGILKWYEGNIAANGAFVGTVVEYFTSHFRMRE